MYDDGGNLALQVTVTANSDNTLTAQAVGVGGASVWYSLPSGNTIPVNQWFSLLGSSVYLDTTANTATVRDSNGMTWTFRRDASNNLVVHTDNGDPDIVIEAVYLLGALPGRRIHTADLGCDAASFALGFFGAAIAVSAIGAMIAARGRGAAHMAAAAITLGSALYVGLGKACGIK